jgi:hypothetical protein
MGVVRGGRRGRQAATTSLPTGHGEPPARARGTRRVGPGTQPDWPTFAPEAVNGMSALASVVALGVGFAVLSGVALLRALTRRLADRAAAWLVPDQQPVSFRVAWMVVRIARWLAPRRICRWGGWTGSGPDYQDSGYRWPGADEAMADLDEGLCSHQAVVHPLRLVLPLLAEAVHLRSVNAGHVVRRWTALSPFLVIFAVLSPLGACGFAVNRAKWLVRRICGTEAV